ncbi:MAG: SCO family protein [Acidobacteria bacterium]|nr:MAG: SCO family protein [Acidobacteriota bacterium]
MRTRAGRHALVASLFALWLAGRAAVPASADQPDEPRPPLEFVPPEPGTYELHRIMRAPEGRVLTVDGRVEALSRFTRERITLLGFIYTSCMDPEGCPLAYRVFGRLKDEIEAHPALRDEVQLVSLSFDPARDSPSVMKRYAGSRLEEDRGLRWFFLTTRSVEDLLPLVEGFGQDVRYSEDRSTGLPVRQLSHVLKVFLIDRAGYVREIYTSTFLHPRSIMGDIETLLMEQRSEGDPARSATSAR